MHSDVKPENVLLGPGGGRRAMRTCKLVDFGEAWRYDTHTKQWQWLKFNTSESATSSDTVGYPNARWGHTAALVIFNEDKDPDGAHTL